MAIDKKSNVAICGIGCRFPQSPTPQAFWDNLINGRDMISKESRGFDHAEFGLPERWGKIPNVQQFDNLFFEVSAKQSEKMDPQLRLLLETAYEAVVDAKINPDDLSGSNTGVFVGTCGSDIYTTTPKGMAEMTGYENTGRASTMYANRISYFLNLKGPSFSVDTACSSALTALDLAVRAIWNGDCDRAIVAGANVIHHPSIGVAFKRLQMLSPTGTSRSFDANANGYARAEAVGAVFLSREHLASTRYARVLASGTNNDGYTDEGITFPNQVSQEALVKSVYDKYGIDCSQVDYLEAHGTGTQAGDPVEINAVDQVFFKEKQRQRPLWIGSVKSNMGHAEGAGGIASVIKVLLSMHHKILPANLHFNTPNPKIPSLAEGHINVVSEPVPLGEGLVSITSSGFGGANVHVVLEQVPATPVADPGFLPMPLIARTKEGLDAQVEEAQQSQNPAALSVNLGLINAKARKKHPFRGFLYRNQQGQWAVEKTAETNGETRPIWLVFNGVGSQWPSMGRGLREFPVCREVLNQCAQVLAAPEFDLDLWDLLTTDRDDAFGNPVNLFVGITAVQIALYKLVTRLGVQAEGFLGHSLGELPCAYADGCLTLEQTIAIAFYRGRVLEEQAMETGAMAAVQMSRLELENKLPKGVWAACFNANESITVSGSKADVTAFHHKLREAQILSKLVDSSGIAFHSPLIAGAQDRYRQQLEALIPMPLARSSLWLCTNRPQSQPAPLADADYFIKNLLAPVEFAAALEQVPSNALILELGPHALLRSLIRGDKPDSLCLGLMKKHQDEESGLWAGLGDCHLAGLDLDWPALAGEVGENPRFPITHACTWDHSRTWPLPDLALDYRATTDVVETFVLDITKEENTYIKDHLVNGKVIVPGVCYIYLAWQTLARMEQVDPENLSVEFRDIRFLRATLFSHTNVVELTVKYDPTSHRFQVMEGSQLVADGLVKRVGGVSLKDAPFERAWEALPTNLDRDAVYPLFALSGIEYGRLFRGLTLLSQDKKNALIEWNSNWPTYFDSAVQFIFLATHREAIGLPRSIESFRFDPSRRKHGEMPAVVDAATRSIRTPCLEVEGIEINTNFEVHPQVVERLAHGFVPYHQTLSLSPERQVYSDLLSAYIAGQIKTLVQGLASRGDPLPTHVAAIVKVFAKLGHFPTVDSETLERFLEHPQAHNLRLARHIFSQPEQLLSDPMPLIVSFPEYDRVYRRDLSLEHREESLRVLIDMVIANHDHPSSVRVVEIGAGTGGLTSVTLPYCYRFGMNYAITDISAGFFSDLKTEFRELGKGTSYYEWDINEKNPKGETFDLILAANALHAVPCVDTALKNAAQALAPGGFLLLEEVTDSMALAVGIWGFIPAVWEVQDPHNRQAGMFMSKELWEKAAHRCGLTLAACHRTRGHVSYMLFRKCPSQDESAIHIRYDTRQAEHLTQLQKAMANKDENTVLWVSADKASAPGWPGMAACLWREFPGQIKTMYLLDKHTPDIKEQERVQTLGMIMNVWQNGVHGTFGRSEIRHSRPSNADRQLRVEKPGDLSSLIAFPMPAPAEGETVYRVSHFPLNFKDVVLGAGQITQSRAQEDGTKVGLEFAGVREDDSPVFGLFLRDVGMGDKISLSDPWAVWPTPPNWTPAQACTVPLAYATAYTALVLRAEASQGQSVLIHSGAGALGQAAIRIAHSLGMEIFTTAGSAEKRRCIRELFPHIDSARIADSRSSDFKTKFLAQTQGQGIDIVLNTLSGDLFRAGLELTASHGHFVDLSRKDVADNLALPLKYFAKNISFHNFALDEIYQDQRPERETIHQWMSQGIAQGVIQPLSYEVHTDVSTAMKALLSGNTTGKLVLETASCLEKVPRRYRFFCHPDKTYLVTGGLGGVGLELAFWLILRGARHLVLTSRQGAVTPYQQFRLKHWREDRGIDIRVSTQDVCDANQAEALVAAIEAQHPLGGLFHLAMVLEDRAFLDFSAAEFDIAVKIKADALAHLDQAVRKQCRSLDQFVAFSSIVSGMGNEGQANYGYGNCVMEMICRTRMVDGLPGLAIQWGAIDDVGFVARKGIELMFAALGLKPQRLHSVLETLEHFLDTDEPVVASQTPLSLKAGPAEEGGGQSCFDQVMAVLGLGREAQDLPNDTQLADLGMDSLMTVEIRQLLAREYHIDISLQEIRQLSIRELQELEGGKAAQTKPKTTDLTKPSQTMISITDPLPETIKSRVCYYFNGFALASRISARRMILRADTTYIFVPYGSSELPSNLDGLAAGMAEHMDGLPEMVRTIETVGFSAGAHVMQNTMGRHGLAERMDRMIAVAPSDLDLFSPRHLDTLMSKVQGHTVKGTEVVEIKALLQDPARQAENHLATRAFLLQLFPEFNLEEQLDEESVAGQLALFAELMLQQEPRLDQAWVIQDDCAGISVQQARIMAKTAIVVDGHHDTSWIDLNQFK